MPPASQNHLFLETLEAQFRLRRVNSLPTAFEAGFFECRLSPRPSGEALWLGKPEAEALASLANGQRGLL